MIGQGRPNTSQFEAADKLVGPQLPRRSTSTRRDGAGRAIDARLRGPRRSRQAACAVVRAATTGAAVRLVGLCAWLVTFCATAAAADEPAMRLRMEWGGGREHVWRATVSATDGALSAPAPLGVEADEPGSMWIADGALEVQSRSTRTYDGVDFTIAAPLKSSLHVNLLGGNPGGGQSFDVPLEQVAQEVFTAPIDASGNRLLVRRVPGDRLRVKLGKDSVIYSPGEVAEIEVAPHRLAAGSGNRVLLVAQLFAARTSREPLWTNERELTLTPEGSTTAPAELDVKLPDVEGVYDLRLTLHRRALQNRLGWKQTVEERKVQLVVIARERPNRHNAAALPAVAETLFEMDPASPPWWERLTNVPSIPGLRRGPLGNGDAKPWHHALGSLIQLGPGGREPNVSWEAFPLPIAKPGQPHVVEVEYPTDVAQTLGVSIVEPNVAGQVTPIGLDAGIYVPEEGVEGKPRLAKHRLIFWPRTKTPLLLLTNQRDGSQAVFGKVRVIGPKASVVSTLGRDTSRPAFLPRAFPDESPGGDRLLAGYFDRPLFPENFSANEAFDEWSGRGLDDWVTYYEGATRLVEYLEHVGYNGLVMTVLADGSAIYPSQLLEPTPRYDTGTYFASGQDPIRKDILELLFRLFDREGLKLVPALQFSAPLPALETVKRQGGALSEGIEPVEAEGQSWVVAHGTRQGLAPYYNPLNVRVQDAMLAVVRELCERYQDHDSFAALGVQLSADGYAQLPGADWGYDEQTVSRFVREKGVHALERENHAARVKSIMTTHRAAWLEWRCQALNQLHRRMQGEFARVKDGPARLYLAGAHLFERPDIEQLVFPSLRSRSNVETVMQTLGIDAKLYQSNDDLVLLRPQWIEPLSSLTEQAVGMELNQSLELDRALHARTASAALFFHKPQQLHLPTFDAKSPFKGAQMLLVGQPTPVGGLNRRRFIHAIASLDAGALFDGGWLLPLGDEESLADLVAAYRELPTGQFETISGASQPVVIRRYTNSQGTYVYFVNDSPWNARVTIDLEVPSDSRFDRFGKTRKLTAPAPTNGRQPWTIDLQPYELLAGRFAAADVALQNPQVSFEQDVENELYGRINDLGARVAVLQQPAALRQLPNPGFEQQPAEDPLPGWEVRDQPGATASLDAEQKHTGAQSLHLSSAQAAASLVSEPFTPLRSGHVAVLVHLRVADEAQQPPLRIALSARWKGQDYYRYAPVGVRSGQAITTQWTQYLFQVRDLPTEGLTDLRVRFDLTAPGDVWIDDVELREFDEEELGVLKKTITVASYMLESRQLGDCQRLLDGYWPRFLMAHVPVAPDAVAARPKYVPKRSEAPPAEPEVKPGMMERVRRSLPSFLR